MQKYIWWTVCCHHNASNDVFTLLNIPIHENQSYFTETFIFFTIDLRNHFSFLSNFVFIDLQSTMHNLNKNVFFPFYTL